MYLLSCQPSRYHLDFFDSRPKIEVLFTSFLLVCKLVTYLLNSSKHLILIGYVLNLTYLTVFFFKGCLSVVSEILVREWSILI